MLVVIKKYKFFIKKTNFIRFIIKLGYINRFIRLYTRSILTIKALKRIALSSILQLEDNTTKVKL